MIDNNITKSIANAYTKMYEAKAVKREAWVPAEITDEGVADFMGAAADAAKKGDETFKFGDKTYKVTMKKATADKIDEADVEVCEKCGKVHEGSCDSVEESLQEAKKLNPNDKVSIVGRGRGQMDISAHVRKVFKLKDMEAYFDGTDLVIKNKTAVKGALKDPRMTIADLEDAVRKSGLVKEVAEPEAQGEKDFKDMHTNNTKKSGEKDDGTVEKP
jgi:hypothetical protein